MSNKIRTPRCDNCKFYTEDKNYRGEGTCSHPLAEIEKSDGRYTREHRVCNLLKTDDERREAKINPYRRYIY